MVEVAAFKGAAASGEEMKPELLHLSSHQGERILSGGDSVISGGVDLCLSHRIELLSLVNSYVDREGKFPKLKTYF